MILELKDGYYIDYWYDKHTRSWITQTKDMDGNQVGEAVFSGDIPSRDYEIRRIKNEFMVESIESKAKETKRKTKKSKLNPFKSMSPIMPNPAGGIDKFNHAMGVDSTASSDAGSSDDGGMAESLNESITTEKAQALYNQYIEIMKLLRDK